MASSQEPNHRSKKRKSHPNVPDHLDVQLDEPSTSLGPVFGRIPSLPSSPVAFLADVTVNFPSVRPSSKIPFKLYSRDAVQSDNDQREVKDITSQRTLLAGETEDVEFFSVNRDHLRGGEAADCRYLPAIYDPSTNSLTIHPTTPLYLMAHRPKRIRAELQASQSSPEKRAQYRAQRNDLGETFGTRKAKSAIKAEERNRVDVGAMEGVKGHLMDSIGEAKVQQDESGPSEHIPSPNTTTASPLEIYSRQALIPDDEYSSISANDLIRANDHKSRLALLPWYKGRWFEVKLRGVMEGPSEQRKQNMKYIYYLSSLHHFLSLSGILPKLAPTEIQAKCRGVPNQIINGFLSRFTEKIGNKYTITEKMKLKFISWICCLCLILDGGSVEVSKIAKDLGIPDTKVIPVFRSLGCSIESPSAKDRETTGMSAAEALKNKRASLRAPVKFPKPAKRGPQKR